MKMTVGQRIFLILSLIIPLLYLSMYLPIWNGKEISLTNAGMGPLIPFIFQCICLVLAILQILFANFRNTDNCLLTFVIFFFLVCSLWITLVIGSLFILELFNI